MGKTRKKTHFIYRGRNKPLMTVQGTDEIFTDSSGKPLEVFFDQRGRYWFASEATTGLQIKTARHDTKSGVVAEIQKRVDEIQDMIVKINKYGDNTFSKLQIEVGKKIATGDFIPYDESEV